MNFDLITGVTREFSGLSPIHLNISEDDDVISDLNVLQGFSHRAVERCLESVPVSTAMAIIERIDPWNAVAYSLSFAEAIEKNCNIGVLSRASGIRLIFLELSRLMNHIAYFSKISRALNAQSAFNFCLREFERYADLLELYIGRRMPFGIIKIGGVSQNISEGTKFKLESLVSEIDMFIDELKDVLVDNPLFRFRVTDLAVLDASMVHKFSIKGINARASNCLHDSRENLYSRFLDEWSTSIDYSKFTGDTLSRIQIRIEEMKEAKAVIIQALNLLKDGGIITKIDKGFKPLEGMSFASSEGSRGEIDCFVVIDQFGNLNRVKFMNPSLFMLRALKDVVCGESVDDLNLIVSSLDILGSEVDR